MNANTFQLQKIEKLKTEFNLLKVENYGFYSNGSIGVKCSDIYGEFSVTINEHGDIN